LQAVIDEPAGGTEGLGAALKAARVARGYSLVDVADATGISKSSLSLIENDRSDVPLRRLIRLAEFYETQLSDLLPDRGGHDPVVVRRRERPHLYSRAEGLDVHRLAPPGKRTMLPAVCVFSPGGGADFARHEGEEFVLVLEGRLLLELEGSEPVVLERGDSAYYPSDRPHRWSNAGDEITRLVSVASPPHW
jgi:quercetin dioxygenase-like cupin family protein/DNA-binding Xre family transcriptional regulator